MEKEHKNYAIILAAGAGERFGSDQPKQFIRLGGIPIFIRTLRLFHECKQFDQILLVSNPDFLEETKSLIKEYISQCEVTIVPGGSTRTASVAYGLAALDGQSDDLVVIHDAVRPFLDVSVITNGLNLMRNESIDGVNTTISSNDTLVKINPLSKFIQEVPKRREFLRGQTPQFFAINKLKLAFEKMSDSGIEFTEECALLLAAFPDSKILCIDGSEKNVKITSKQDLVIAQNLLRTPSEYDFTNEGRIEDTVVIVGGTNGLGLRLCKELELSGVEVKIFSRRTGNDINDVLGRARILDWIWSSKEKIHLVFTAGTIEIESILTLDEESFINQFRTNVISIAMCISEVVKKSPEKIKSIVLLGSSAGMEGRENLISYSSSKAALVAFMQSVSEELFQLGIRINVIVPERINSELRKSKFVDKESVMLEETDVVKVIKDCLVNLDYGKIISVRKI
jgi:2-C-methyl-D-erythritol 4-phosphate cytidylyltransferase